MRAHIIEIVETPLLADVEMKLLRSFMNEIPFELRSVQANLIIVNLIVKFYSISNVSDNESD